MASTLLESLRGILRKSKPTTQQLADAIELARRNERDAVAAVERAAQVVTSGFMDEPSKRQADRAVLAEAKLAAEDAGMVLAETERRHAEALAEVEQLRRRTLYDGARQQADEAATALTKTYPGLAAGMVAMLRDLAKAQAAVNTANHDDNIPTGAPLIEDPELRARGTPGLPREVVSDEWIEAWGRFDSNVPVDEPHQSEIYEVGHGWGKRVVPSRSAGLLSTGDAQPVYRRRLFRKVTTRTPTNGDFPLALAAALQLPAVRGSGMLWGEANPMFAPGLSLAVGGGTEPEVILARLAEMDAAATARPVKVERPLHVEYPEYSEVEPLPVDVTIPDTVSRRGDVTPPGSRFGASPYAPVGARRQ